MRASEDVSEKQYKTYDSIRSNFKNGDYEPNIKYSSSEDMREIKDNSIQLIITSPPYNVGKNYGIYDDSKHKEDYLQYLDNIWAECKRVLCKGGRIAVNLANVARARLLFDGKEFVLDKEDLLTIANILKTVFENMDKEGVIFPLENREIVMKTT